MMLIAMICGAVLVSCGGSGDSGSKDKGGKETTATSSSKNAEDQMLDEFEKFVEEYIEHAKALMAGDQAAVLKAEQMSSDYEDLMGRITLAEEAGKFTPEQIERGSKIGEKMAEAFGL